ncbi:hypothetical protein OOZ63_21380 [Paucibacter sp. PLA-PC-4]|uniref:hypothetical protein n=1 Tax=Paucibacter sp. PLA-PC-4 TaxID=2993655 RepID=UPI00224B1164|nr:hypothetical protein [Paucibacter sp. PLA-PC-4]MCX2864385.1 hypothetical protein [Paucibacter sp. PLA-PC-4]
MRTLAARAVGRQAGQRFRLGDLDLGLSGGQKQWPLLLDWAINKQPRRASSA